MPKLLGLYALPPAVGEPAVGAGGRPASSSQRLLWPAWMIRGDNFRAAATIYGKNQISAQTGLKGYGTTVKHWEASVVPAYRIYELHARRRVVRPALILIRENDADVIRTVKPPVDGHDVEIMEGARVVARLSNRQIVAAR
jgi:hypothetical protein